MASKYGALGVVALAFAPGVAHAFCNTLEVIGFDVYCGGAGHDEATANLDFLRPQIFTEITEEVGEQDSGEAENRAEIHFDSCRFQESTSYVRGRYDAAVSVLDPANPRPFEAAMYFGDLLHPVQDFYAHANYVELLEESYGPEAYVDPAFLIDRGTGPFRELAPLTTVRDDIVVGERPLNLPSGWTSFSATQDLYDAVPIVQAPGVGTFRGLVTGWNAAGACLDVRGGPNFDDAYGDDRTPRLTHGGGSDDRPCEEDYPTGVCLNKDKPERPFYDEAITLAGWQTQQEWCRLLHLAKNSPYGINEASELLTLWANPSQSPLPDVSACAPGAPGPMEVRVTVDAITARTLTGSHDPDSHYVFGLYTDDFAHSTSVAFSSKSRNPSPPGSTTMCIYPGQRPVATVWGWRDTGTVAGAFDPGDVVLSGATFAGLEDATAHGRDIDATFRFEIDPKGVDDDNLSPCAEAFYGSSDQDTDSDDDGLDDDTEIILGTSPIRVDTDGDYLDDYEEVVLYTTSPTKADTDGDGLTDAQEIELGSNPLRADSDNDGLTDWEEYYLDTMVLDPDTDDDGLGDGPEVTWGLDPTVHDLDLDGVMDGLDLDWVRGLIADLPDTAFATIKTAPSLRTTAVTALNPPTDPRQPYDPVAALGTAKTSIAACAPTRGTPPPTACAAIDAVAANLSAPRR